jgi:hypothetical protein
MANSVLNYGYHLTVNGIAETPTVEEEDEGGGPGYAYPSFAGNENIAVVESPAGVFTFTATGTDACAANGVVGDFLMRLDCPLGTDGAGAVGLHTSAASRDYGDGYYEVWFNSDQVKTLHYSTAASFTDIPDGDGPVFVRRVGNTIDVRYGGTSWADATPLVDAALAAYEQTLDWLWVYLYSDRTSLTLSFLALP